MHICFQSQRLVSLIEYIYNTLPDDGKLQRSSVSEELDFLYDFLIDQGHNISFAPQIKAELWALSIGAFKFNEKRDPQESDKELIHKYYKSFLVKRFLMDKLPERLFLYREDGKRITKIELTVK